MNVFDWRMLLVAPVLVFWVIAFVGQTGMMFHRDGVDRGVLHTFSTSAYLTGEGFTERAKPWQRLLKVGLAGFVASIAFVLLALLAKRVVAGPG